MGSLNTDFLTSKRGIAKIAEIIVGVLLCSLLCGVWLGLKK
jgi:hypothetical protein